ncbi:unnamed protein product [Caenorhabditis auriculariae]|uniref:Uncharacterized protein n=1 Tax=Caenorhabditis auriculariae TaxID=2777116 RepID=A0A8S1GRK2_9PELO|nr:unnamed protein product [Caenorhabditis auriculariae]
MQLHTSCSFVRWWKFGLRRLKKAQIPIVARNCCSRYKKAGRLPIYPAPCNHLGRLHNANKHRRRDNLSLRHPIREEEIPSHFSRIFLQLRLLQATSQSAALKHPSGHASAE